MEKYFNKTMQNLERTIHELEIETDYSFQWIKDTKMKANHNPASLICVLHHAVSNVMS